MQNQPILHIDINHSYLDEESEPEANKYMFAYSIEFKNLSDSKLQLLNYFWVLTNSEGKEREIFQDSLEGEYPILLPNDSFEYSKGILLDTPLGTLHGYFTLLDDQNRQQKIVIPAFRLCSDLQIH